MPNCQSHSNNTKQCALCLFKKHMMINYDSRNQVSLTEELNCLLLYEYKDLFIDMDVRKNRSELAIANRHQER